MRRQPCQPAQLDILACWHREGNPRSIAGPTNHSRAFRFEIEKRIGLNKINPSRFPFSPLINASGDFRTCIQCGKKAPRMKRCSGCRWTRYCNRDCQKADWRTHRTVCCPDHALPRHQKYIPYSRHKYESLAAYRSAEDERTAAMTMVASALRAPSAISTSSSSNLWIRTEAEHAAFRQSAEIDFEPPWRESIHCHLDKVLARYPPSGTAEAHPSISADVPNDPLWCVLCTMWLRDKPQYDDHLIGRKHRRRKTVRRHFCRQIREVARMFHADYESKQCARMCNSFACMG
jgi:hypothetical protein